MGGGITESHSASQSLVIVRIEIVDLTTFIIVMYPFIAGFPQAKSVAPILGSKIDVIIGAHSPSSVVCINFHLYFIERTLLCACFLVTTLFHQAFNVNLQCYMKLPGVIPLVGLPHLNNMLLSLQLHLENWVY